MSYQVLARKWRPRRFSELVGQDHVVRPLVNALERDRMHHAFLFTGTRGVGKTTIARILAKSLNCETGVSAQPCGTCRACTEIDEGRFLDLIEVDAASRTKVDDTRELLDNVQYAPTRGRYKVYLIDEVHMLSGHSFNALLKTLEEPPPHVKFLLATTDPQRLPVTVLSRCLQFNLKRLAPELIAAQLEKILRAEQVGFDQAAVPLLAQAADGSMRDGLSLLDQAIAYGGGKLVEAEVREMLGSIDQDAIERLLQAAAANDGPGLLTIAADLARHNADCDQVLKELLFALHRIALTQTAPQVLAQTAEEQRWLRHAQALAPEDVQLFYQIGLLGRRDLPLAPDPRTGLEMTLLRMLAFRPAGLEGQQAVQKEMSGQVQTTTAPRASTPATPPPIKQVAAPTPVVESANADAPVPATNKDTSWTTIVAQLKLAGLARELAHNCSLERATPGEVRLVLAPDHADLNNKERAAALKQALTEYYGRETRLHIRLDQSDTESPAQTRARAQDERQQAATAAISKDPTVRALQEQFDARIQPGSIRPKVEET